jgi:cytidylate kinase
MKIKDYLNEDIYDCFFIAPLSEGKNDPSIFKAVFLAGGPGSGKSFISSQTTGGFGMKTVNSDTLFELLSKKEGLDLKNFPDEEEMVRNQVRGHAKNLTKKQMYNYIKGRLGLVIDGTGKDFDKIKKQRASLESLGYDTYMIFVNTSLDVALERNNKRARTVPEPIVTQSWKDVQNNMGKFQTLFGSTKFKIIDNNTYSSDLTIFTQAWKEVMKFVNKPVTNHIAVQWIKEN